MAGRNRTITDGVDAGAAFGDLGHVRTAPRTTAAPVNFAIGGPARQGV
jgi:hypothetical protein